MARNWKSIIGWCLIPVMASGLWAYLGWISFETPAHRWGNAAADALVAALCCALIIYDERG